MPRNSPTTVLPLGEYDHILVMFSGGKDSLACVLFLLDSGVPADRIELWHHDVDGESGSFMDWPCTAAYVRRVADHLHLPLYRSWRRGGFLKEMLRKNQATSPVVFAKPDGSFGQSGGSGPLNSRLRFPQLSADLSVRWCSASLKIDVADIAIRNQTRFLGKNTLVVSGERAEESAARSRYLPAQQHRCWTKSRRVDHWRPLLLTTQKRVWEIIAQHSIYAHPAYHLGWGRASCMTCIFGSPNQWATIRKIDRVRFDRLVRFETEFGTTMMNGETLPQLAHGGTPYPASDDATLVSSALDVRWNQPVLQQPWVTPVGAFGEQNGPS